MPLSGALFGAASALMVLSVFAVGLRMYVRIFMIKSVGVDDYLIVVAVVCYVAAEAFVFDATRLTTGKNILEILDVLTPGLIDIYFGELFYVISVWALKFSIGTFLLRLVQNRRQKYIILGTLLLVTLYNIAYLCLIIFQCTPVEHAWKPLGSGHCLSGKVNTSTSYGHAALTGVTDLVFAILPIFVVWDLKMNTPMKISVAGLLGIGAIAGITSFIRMPYIKALAKATPIDFFVVTYRLAIWTSVEPGVGIFVGSLATLRPLFRKVLGGSGLFSSKTSSSARGGGVRGGVGSSHDRYWRATTTTTATGGLSLPLSPKGSSHPYELETFDAANRKAGFTTTIVEGTLTKNGKRWGSSCHFDSASSQEELSRDLRQIDSKDGIQRTVEFEAISTTRVMRSPTPTIGKAITTQGRHY